MNTKEERIKLAEAMGWTNIRSKYIAMEEKSYPFGVVPGNVNDKRFKEQIPDPFTDANDDYAVLEWMRKTDLINSLNVTEYEIQFWWKYKIGDYARAALKMIEQGENDGQSS